MKINKKVLRIILAIIIIAVIMTGVSFGIIALLNKISGPCANQPGKVYNDDLKKCVPRTCDDGQLCKIKGATFAGKCVSNDYCKKYNGTQYIYDPDTCQCTIKCNKGEKPFTKTGKSTTLFNEDGTPAEELTCGISCPTNPNKPNTPGGEGWCPANYLCGSSFAEDGTNLSPDSSCFINGVKCDNSDNICPSKDDCIIPDKGARKGKMSCLMNICGANNKGNDDDEVYACKTDSDCVHKGTTLSGATCIKGKKVAAAGTKFQYFDDVGYCSHTNQLKDKNCTTKKLIGEGKDGTIVNCATHNTTNNSNIEGVNGKLNNCTSLLVPGSNHACSINGLCTNKWQASDNTGAIECKPGAPPSSTDLQKDLTICCPSSNIATNPDGTKFCCPVQVNPGTQLCTLNTNYGYSKQHLGIKGVTLDETIECQTDSECNASSDGKINYNDLLWQSLGNTGKNQGNSLLPSKINPKGDANKFAKLYCDKTEGKEKGVCKASCGLFDGENKSDTYGVINNDTTENKFSYCFPKKNDCELAKITYPKGDINGFIPVCHADGKEDAWTAPKGSGYKVDGQVTIKPKDKDQTQTCKKTPTDTQCLNLLGQNFYNVDSITAIKDGCEFTSACDNIPLSYEKSDDNIKSINWSDLLNYDIINDVPSSYFDENKISHTPISELNPYKSTKSGDLAKYYYYNPNENCKGDTTSTFNPKGFPDNITQSPLNFIKKTKACTTTNRPDLKLLPSGLYCKDGINPTTGDCYKSEEIKSTKEKFENFNTSQNPIEINYTVPENMYVQIQQDNPTTGNITDDSQKRYYCAYFGMTTDPSQKSQTVKRADDGAEMYLNCTDNIDGGVVKCASQTGETGNCCTKDSSAKNVKIIKKGDKFVCSGATPDDSNKQYKNYFQCTDSESDVVTFKGKKYSKAKIITNKEERKDGTIIDKKGITDPGLCNLKNELIKLGGNGTSVNIKACDAIKWNGNGCGDLDHNLGNGKFKDGWGWFSSCRLNTASIPFGLEASFFIHPDGSWVDEKYMCRNRSIFKTVPYDHGTRNITGLDKNTCSARFTLSSKNPNACK